LSKECKNKGQNLMFLLCCTRSLGCFSFLFKRSFQLSWGVRRRAGLNSKTDPITETLVLSEKLSGPFSLS